MKGKCPYCNEEKEFITKLGRLLCKDCWKKTNEDKSDPEIGIKDVFYLFFDSRCSYYPAPNGSDIRFGGSGYGAELATLMLIHEYNHHVIKKLEGLITSNAWDGVSSEGRLEKLTYDPYNC